MKVAASPQIYKGAMPESRIQVTSHFQLYLSQLSFIPLRGSILRLLRGPSPRAYSYRM